MRPGSVADLDLSDVAVRRTSEDTRIIEAALEYRAACAAMRPLWVELLCALAGSPARAERARLWRAGGERVRIAKVALLETASGRTGAYETGAEEYIAANMARIVDRVEGSG